MDQIHAMRVFVAVLDAGSLTAAGQRLRRSPAAISRALDFLEGHLGVELLHRTTRSVRLSEAGARYATAARRVLADLDEADLSAAGEGAAPRGLLTLTGPQVSGARILRPVIDEFLELYPAVSARLLMLDRHVNLVDEGIDVAMRIAELPDSSLTAIRLGTVHRLVCAAPSYLAGRPAIATAADVTGHHCIAMTVFGQDSWMLPGPDGTMRPVRITPRLAVNTVEAAAASAVEGRGLTRLFSYQVADELADGRLVPVLADPPDAGSPVHLLTPEGRLAVPKVRAFVDFAVPRLRAVFARIASTTV
jgi:DNA-binding transcriptional LysR family regulator